MTEYDVLKRLAWAGRAQAYAETFGLVMTEAILAGLPVVGASYGALGERIRAAGAGWTIDPTAPRYAALYGRGRDAEHRAAEPTPDRQGTTT